jgi:AraC-like DNA-binding protein
LNLLRALEGTVEMHLSDTSNLESIFSEMSREYKEPSANSAQLIHGYLQVVLVKLLRNKVHANSLVSAGNDAVYRKFLNVQNSNPISNLKVNEVSAALNISPQNLNVIVKKASGKSASEFITEQVLLEAKRYLIHTDKTVSEIAFSLEFSDPSHFVKHFKKATGETPQAFRTRHFQ